MNIKKLNNFPELIPLKSVQDVLNRSESTVQRFVRFNHIERIKDGQRTYVTKTSLKKALQNIGAMSVELLE